MAITYGIGRHGSFMKLSEKNDTSIFVKEGALGIWPENVRRIFRSLTKINN